MSLDHEIELLILSWWSGYIMMLYILEIIYWFSFGHHKVNNPITRALVVSPQVLGHILREITHWVRNDIREGLCLDFYSIDVSRSYNYIGGGSLDQGSVPNLAGEKDQGRVKIAQRHETFQV